MKLGMRTRIWTRMSMRMWTRMERVGTGTGMGTRTTD